MLIGNVILCASESLSQKTPLEDGMISSSSGHNMQSIRGKPAVCHMGRMSNVFAEFSS
jgi:hypothetical protein